MFSMRIGDNFSSRHDDESLRSSSPEPFRVLPKQGQLVDTSRRRTISTPKKSKPPKPIPAVHLVPEKAELERFKELSASTGLVTSPHKRLPGARPRGFTVNEKSPSQLVNLGPPILPSKTASATRSPEGARYQSSGPNPPSTSQITSASMKNKDRTRPQVEARPASRTQTTQPPPAKQPNLMRRITSKLRLAPLPTAGLPSPLHVNDIVSREKREKALRERGLIPPLRQRPLDLSELERQRDHRLSVVIPLDASTSTSESEARKIKEEWLSKWGDVVHSDSEMDERVLPSRRNSRSSKKVDKEKAIYPDRLRNPIFGSTSAGSHSVVGAPPSPISLTASKSAGPALESFPPLQPLSMSLPRVSSVPDLSETLRQSRPSLQASSPPLPASPRSIKSIKSVRSILVHAPPSSPPDIPLPMTPVSPTRRDTDESSTSAFSSGSKLSQSKLRSIRAKLVTSSEPETQTTLRGVVPSITTSTMTIMQPISPLSISPAVSVSSTLSSAPPATPAQPTGLRNGLGLTVATSAAAAVGAPRVVIVESPTDDNPVCGGLGVIIEDERGVSEVGVLEEHAYDSGMNKANQRAMTIPALTAAPAVTDRRKSLSLFRKGEGANSAPSSQQVPRSSSLKPSLSKRTTTSLVNLRKSFLGGGSRPASQMLSPRSMGGFDASHLPPSPTLPMSFKSAGSGRVSESGSESGSGSGSGSGSRIAVVKGTVVKGTGVGPRRRPVSPTIHSRGTILLGLPDIPDEESRRLSEMAFLT